MPTNKTATLTLRIDPESKEALRVAAQKEHRSISNMVEFLILDHCNANQIPVQDPREIDYEDFSRVVGNVWLSRSATREHMKQYAQEFREQAWRNSQIFTKFMFG